MQGMRFSWAALLAIGCTTVRTGRELRGTDVGPTRCGQSSYVVTAMPLDYPNVLLDVVEDRACEVEVSQTYVEHYEVHVSETVIQWTAVGLGALAGLGGFFALERSYRPTTTTVPQYPGGYTVAYQGDAAIILPFVGAVAGFAGWYLLGKGQTPVETLPAQTEVDRHIEPRLQHTASVDGTLTLLDGSSATELHGGHAVMNVQLAQRAHREGLLLDGRPIEWSVRAGTWAPALTPQCARTQDAAEAAAAFETAPLGALARASRDAAACASEGWRFASEVARRLERICQRRFDSRCEAAAK
jgi:hypothetical protein